MRKYIITLIKWGLLVFFAIIVSVLLYHELWFLEYYHLPPVSFVRIEPERTRLINGIESYQSIDEFKGSLSRSLFQWEEGKDNQPASTGRPPFNTHTITVKNYSHLGF